MFYNRGKQSTVSNLILSTETMFYRPNFCCNCGEKIERVDWGIFTSGKFCDLCATEFRAHEWVTKLLAAVGIVFAIALISSVFRPPQTGVKPAAAETTPVSAPAEFRDEAKLNTTPVSPLQSQTETNVNTSTVSPPSANRITSEPAVKTTEAVYYCGAATKKGTPCSRRVKRPGDRCWQHQGMPSILDEGRTARK